MDCKGVLLVPQDCSTVAPFDRRESNLILLQVTSSRKSWWHLHMQHTEGLYQSWTSKWERAVFCVPSFPSGCCKERRRAEVLYDWFDAVAGNLRFHLFVPFKTYYLLVQQKRVEESWLENIRNGMKMAYGGGLPGSSAHLPSVPLIHEYSCCAFMVGRCSSCNRESRLFAYGFLMNVSSFLQCRST